MDDIIKLFFELVYMKPIPKNTTSHDGNEGQWLEKQFGLKCNSKCQPDLFGFEMKKNSDKITLGDWSASEYIWSKKREYINSFNKWDSSFKLTRVQFFQYFGQANPEKHNRLSYSGLCVPKYGTYNSSGQCLEFNDDGLCIFYDNTKDQRKKDIPDFLQGEKRLIMFWKSEKLKDHVEKKFNQKGFFICNKIDCLYKTISFGHPFNYEHFVENIKNKHIIFDSGMYNGNSRNYSHFRATKTSFWNSLIHKTLSEVE